MVHKYTQTYISPMTDEHLESFIKCPYKIYYQQNLEGKESDIRWRQIVQLLINGVVQAYYQLPVKEQTKLMAFKLIDHYWSNVSLRYFQSKEKYYMILAKTTDHLLQFLSTKNNDTPPLILYEKLHTYMKVLEMQFSITLELVEWSTKSFTIKKFLVDADQELIDLYTHLLAVFSYEAFGILPEKIEIYSLMEGEVFVTTPSVKDIPKGVMYLEYMKDLVQNGSLSHCVNCPFTDRCKEDHSIIPNKNKNKWH
ncbi:hypothetical protein [Metabacillus endolithicus]|uniref:PD-(D/E)XK endonuclease-like domain-containing protein n=1 Tax=Metabacillus endolithicus TaxID=1535204 RepID=A0ABW5C0R3_9BACI|nr:hypothetical protein [Metabacillus endolithicus]UPG65174.1 hypothetical protein MVE64_09390 [Metabacillus endolithicus]